MPYRLTVISSQHGRLTFCLVFILLFAINQSQAVNRTSVASGNFSQAATWNPAGVPGPNDQVTVQNSHTITVDNNVTTGRLTIANGGKLTFSPAAKLTVHEDFFVYGIAEIIEGDIELSTPGAAFTIGATGSLIWQPANNTASGASLFINGNEYFHPASTLIINKWYNYSGVPLGSVVTGNFGNLTLSTLTGGLLYEWNQNNEFESHLIQGTLSIEQGWIVFDKSGAISNTSVGAICLNNINSYLDFHSGSHPGSFTVVTNSLKNIGGNLNGLYNGNGNINIRVNGDFTNLGNTVLIYNSGIAGISNGNASMKVTGKCIQSTGDFRGIFNISSTNSGKADLEFGEVTLSGGIFMGQYACHTAGNSSTIRIKGDLSIDFSSGNAKFRGNGLTTLSGTGNNLGLQLTIEGDLVIKGTTAAEFTSSGSIGPETTVIKGISRFEGCTSNFNFGNHSTTLTLYENVEVSGGIVYFSRTNGSLTALLQKNLDLQYGNLSITGGNGNCNMIISGDYHQTGGSLFFHNNNSIPTPDIIYATIHGDFFNQSGNITFDNNAGSTAQHRLSLNGSEFTISGNAGINSAVSATDPMYGFIYYDHTGETTYREYSTAVLLSNVRQVINSGCNLKILTGDMQSAVSIQPEQDMILVAGNGILDLGNNHIYAHPLSLNASVMVDEDGRMRISGNDGLYNGASSAAIKAAGNMKYTLDEKSIVEYYGTKEQIITGTGLGTATSANHQYGILEINKSAGSAKLNANHVTARSGIVLKEGELSLNGYNITIGSGLPSAISAASGFIKSESTSDGNSSMVVWKNISPGLHTIPFGTSAGKPVPFMFTPLSGYGNPFAVSTRNCSRDNRPLTNGVTNLNFQGNDAGDERAIDRWFHINAHGITAAVTATYLADENTTNPEVATENFSFITWYDSKWNLTGGAGNGSVDQPGTVTANSIGKWGPLLMISNKKLEAADLLDFDAVLSDGQVNISWTAIPNISPDKYTVERSENEYQFSDLFEKSSSPATGSPINYSGTDFQPLNGISWYRLKQHQTDGNLKYSQAVQIDNSKHQSNSIEILTVNPNPFGTSFTAWYQVPEPAEIRIKLTGSNGQIVYSTILRNQSGKNSFEFSNNSKLTPGLYILTISNGKTSENIKLLHI